MKILYAEDDNAIAEAVKEILQKNNYLVDLVQTGNEAFSYASKDNYDGIMLDVMMPEMSGIEVVSKLRQKGISTPVLMLTAKSMVSDKIEGLDSGADDYLTKPFSMQELLARVRALVRRRPGYEQPILEYGDIRLNTVSCSIICNGKETELINLEYRLLETLVMNSQAYISADTILDKVWPIDSEGDTNAVRVYISKLRRLLEELGSQTGIESKRNIGYRLYRKGEDVNGQ